MPTTPIQTYGMGILVPLKNPDEANTEVLALRPSTTFLAGTLVGEITATPGVYGPYAAANTDGTQNPTHILQYGCVTDATGKVTFGAGPAGTSEWGQNATGCPAFRSGYFNCADLVGLDAGAVTKLGRLVQGTIASGHFMMYGA
jgi:hypothetical protein